MKVIEDILREVDLEVMRKAPHAQRKYNKITESLRNRFLSKIIKEGKSIKKAAEELNINYSSAKTILTLHRKKDRLASKFEHDHDTSAHGTPAKALPPKGLLAVNSFMSTASNLSDMKDSTEESNDTHPSNTVDHIQFNTQRVAYQNKPFLYASSSPFSTSYPQPQVLPQIQKANSIIIAPPTHFTTPIPTNSLMTQISPVVLLQLQQHLQAQQQQQQIQNTLQQLISLQNSMLSSNTAIHNNALDTQNPLAHLLLQNQMALLSQQLASGTTCLSL